MVSPEGRAFRRIGSRVKGLIRDDCQSSNRVDDGPPPGDGCRLTHQRSDNRARKDGFIGFLQDGRVATESVAGTSHGRPTSKAVDGLQLRLRPARPDARPKTCCWRWSGATPDQFTEGRAVPGNRGSCNQTSTPTKTNWWRKHIERMDCAGTGPAAREAYREGFNRLRSQLEMYPVSGRHPSVIFESASKTARNLAAGCLPLGIAVAMHLYPLCVLQCIPLPLLSFARFQRAMLLRTIRNRPPILANAGGERTGGAHHSLVARLYAEGIRVDGTFEYMSLATIADVVFFKARLADSHCTALCAADLRVDSVRIGDRRFSGSMRLSDTSSVTFSVTVVDMDAMVSSQTMKSCAARRTIKDVGFTSFSPTCIWLDSNACISSGGCRFGRANHESQRAGAASRVCASLAR